MRFFFNNLVDLAAAVLTASTENTEFPVENLQNELRGKTWRTLGTVAAESVVFDFGSAQAVTSVILLDHDLTAGDSLIKLEGNATDSWGAPAFSQALTWSSGPISATFGSQSYRYWRVSFTKSAAGQIRNIGRIHIGPYSEFSEEPKPDGFRRKRVDPSAVARSTGGQKYSDVRDKFRTYVVDFDSLPQASVDIIDALFNAVGITNSFFWQVKPGSSLGEVGSLLYGKFVKEPDYPVTAYDSSLLYDMKLELEEAL